MSNCADLKVIRLLLQYPEEVKRRPGMSTQFGESEFLVKHVKRNEAIINLSLSMQENLLVIFESNKHGKFLCDEMRWKIKEKELNRKVFFCPGIKELSEKDTMEKNIQNSDGWVVLTAHMNLSLGTKIPVENIVIACPSYKGEIRSLRDIGSGLYLKSGKPYCNLCDIVDDMRIGRRASPSFRLAEKRRKIYEEEGIQVKDVDRLLG